MERRLAAILAADVVGYSKLVQTDESGTLQNLKALWAEVFEPQVAEHRGRVFKVMGDGALAEFSSAVDAVNCAVAVQEALRARAPGPNGAALTLRIGVNLGDIVVDAGDILGDGVNIAARLETAAPAGGILISEMVQGQVRGKVAAKFADAGEIRLKNIDAPLRVWRWEGTAARQREPGAAQERLSIAVLPFNNMSADPEQEFLADGISEDIITGLSKIRWFLVIARNSTFTYKGKAVDVKRVAQELGVRYVLEGSVRKGGNRIRVTAQLIDAETGLHVWAERYDRELDDIFDLQDEITHTIVGRVEPEIGAAERDRVAKRRTGNLGAWECYQRGLWYMWDYSRGELQRAFEMLTRATELDPNFSTAFAYLCYAHYEAVVMGWSENPERDLDLGMQAARKAIRVDDKDPVGYFAIGRIQMMQGAHDASISSLRKAVELNPSFSQAYHGLSMVLVLSGELDEARAMGEMVERLSPRDPILWATRIVRSLAEVLAGDTGAALAWLRKTEELQRGTGYWVPAITAAAMVQAGRMDEARSAVEEARRQLPTLSLNYLAKSLPTRHPDGLAPYLDALRAAGLPD